MRIDLFFTGAVAYRVAGEDGTALFELFRAKNFAPKGLRRVKKSGEIAFSLSLRESRRFEREAEARGPAFTGRAESGLPLLRRAALRRPGLLVGALLGLALFVLSGLFLWEIEITGGETIETAQLERELAAAGLSRGRFLPALDPDGVAAAMREGDGRLSYVAVNLKGTVAHVQVRETEPVMPPLPTAPANLVAKCDGVVTLPLIFEGECLVGEGEVVRAGQLLASGLIDTQNHGYRVTRAAGQVMARTVHTYTVTVPFAYEEKIAADASVREISLFFFDHARKVFKNTGNLTNDCDIIREDKGITLPSGRKLPVGISVTRARGYAHRPAVRTAAEALRLAREELETLLAADSAGRVLLRKSVETAASGEGVTLVCTVICEEDIAATAELEWQAP